MTFYIEGTHACDVHFENGLIKNIIEAANHEITEYVDLADYIIVVDSCIGSYKSFLEIMNYLQAVEEYKKPNAKVIVSGCLAKGVNFKLTEEHQKLLDKTTIVHPDNLAQYIAGLVEYKNTNEFDFEIPVRVQDGELLASVVQGCLNNCSFCKKNYMNFDLKSVRKEAVKYLVDMLNESDFSIYYGTLISSNLSLYGVDLYKERKAHEAINLFSQINSLKFIQVGALINWYPELINEIIENPKIKTIFTSLETGSPRLYEMMNRPISLEDLIKVIKTIKKERPDIQIDTEFIAGFPTETKDDIKATLNLIEELEVYPRFIHSYINSFCIPSADLPQHSNDYIRCSKKYMDNKIEKIRDKIYFEIGNAEKIVACYHDDYDIYSLLLKNGAIRNVSARKLTRKYNPGDIIK